MTPVLIVLVPVLVLAVVLVFAFAGCALDAEGVMSPVPPVTTTPPHGFPGAQAPARVTGHYDFVVANERGLRHLWSLDDVDHPAFAQDSALITQWPGYYSPAPGQAHQVTHPAISVAGYPSTAASFDGNGGYVNVPYDDSLNPVQEFTVEVWVNPDLGSLGAAGSVVVGLHDAGANRGFALDLIIDAGKPAARATLFDTTPTSVTIPLDPAAHPWRYLAMTYTAVPPTALMLWAIQYSPDLNAGSIQGPRLSQPATYQRVDPASSTPLWIGAGDPQAGGAGSTPQSFYKGMIAEVALYDRAIDQDPQYLMWEHYTLGVIH
jgi:hypothetical protein